MALNADVDYGPLTHLIGTWQGEDGLDVSPEPDGSEESPYYETLVFEEAGDVDNAETQELAAVRYHQIVRRQSNDEVFHDQVGYWIWDAEARRVVQSLAIPRAVCVLAGGEAVESERAVKLEVRAALDDPDWGVVQSPFMRQHARTLAYHHELTVAGDRLEYQQTTTVEIYGRVFEHTDRSVLARR